MRFDRVAHDVPDVAAAISWWQELVPDAEVIHADDSAALIEAGGVLLEFRRGDPRGGRLRWRVSPAALERVVERHGARPDTAADGSRSLELEAPGGTRIEVVASPDPDEDSE